MLSLIALIDILYPGIHVDFVQAICIDTECGRQDI